MAYKKSEDKHNEIDADTQEIVNRADIFPNDGLYLVGEIEDRVRKIVTSQGVEMEVVTYTVTCGVGHIYYVDDFAPDSYFEVREKVIIPVYIKAYKKKNGEASYMLKVQKKDIKIPSRGTRF